MHEVNSLVLFRPNGGRQCLRLAVLRLDSFTFICGVGVCLFLLLEDRPPATGFSSSRVWDMFR